MARMAEEAADGFPGFATVLFQLEEGTKAFIREDRGQWLFIERADGQQGWVKAEALERI